MYYVIGADGNEYGPVSLEQMRKWVSEGRVNAQSKVRAEGSDTWQTAAELSEISQFLPVANMATPGSAQLPPYGQPATAKTGLATTSLVLGILSIICLGPLLGIPAIICGHIARGKIKRSPGGYAGGGMALAGLILGYLSLVLALLMAAVLLPSFSKTKSRSKAQEIRCINQMKQIGLAFKIWEMDNDDQFPFHVSTSDGGTLELASQGPDGVDPNGYLHLAAMSDELSTPRILVCPGDTKEPAADFESLTAENVSYQIMSGQEVTSTNTSAVLAMCPIHGNVLTTDGAVQNFSRKGRSGRR
jgi:hypothetical protein